MQFCRVTHIIKHALPELDGEITGKVRFTPLLGSGESWQVNGGEFTVPAISVTADITDGVLTHDGKPGIELFAAGENSAPGRVIYRVEYQTVKYDGHLARMKSFNFVAVPGGEVNLAEVMPVAGDDGQTEPVVGGAVPFHVHRVAQISDLPAITPLPEAGALVQRLENGHVQVPMAPLSPAHAASADYVDSKATPETVSVMISQAIDALVGTAPDALDTVYELAEYLTDPGLAQGLVAQLSQKADTDHEHTVEQIIDLHHYSGTGFPEGEVSAPVGAVYVDTAATAGAVRWIKTQGTGDTGWVVEFGDTGWRRIGQESVLNGWGFTEVQHFLIRRQGDKVHLLIPMYGLTGESATDDTIFETPEGFTSFTGGNYGALGFIENEVSWVSEPAALRKGFDSITTTARGLISGRVTWDTRDPWPSVRPGTPA